MTGRSRPTRQEFWLQLIESLWFIPALIVLGMASLAIALVELSGSLPPEVLERHPRLFGADAESSRSMLSTIAGSIITVAGVTFSVTVVAVAQASGQYSPRVLRNFMRDRGNQLTAGVMVGVFVYCLIVMRTIRQEGEGDFVPSLAMLAAVALAIIAVAFFIYFIHHITETLEAGNIVARISGETIQVVDRLSSDGEESPAHEESTWNDLPCGLKWHGVLARSSGYIQDVDTDGLCALACERDTLFRVDHAAGDFAAEGTILLSVATCVSDSRMEAQVNRCFTTNTFRTVHQDLRFGIRQIVDIALKALSPGINDTTTAITCLDYLGAILAHVARKRMLTPHRVVQGRLRLIMPGPTFANLLDAAFDEIRRNAQNNARVLIRMLEVLEKIGECTSNGRRRAVLRTHAQRILSTAEREVQLPYDHSVVLAAYRSAARSLDDTMEPAGPIHSQAQSESEREERGG